MTTVQTLGGEEISVGLLGHEALSVTVTDPRFGRIASVRLDLRQAAQLANALDEGLVTAAGDLHELPEV